MNPQTHDDTQSDNNGGIAAAISSGLTTETKSSSGERTTSNSVTENHDVTSAEANSNIVVVSHQVHVCSIALPHVLNVVLVVRVGEPLGSARGGWRKKLVFDVEKGYEGFRDKCHGLFAEVAASPEAAKVRVTLKDDRENLSQAN
ncbi:hypothetical protein PC129_g11718 [Phytophthora cactorum]|uniref:Uncharacterized protein n=1 Tax=Phytophthora cactorum TaxID=29920 RepID=A0A329RXV6_9STRA|nr:hypothetical protein Pcac1_g17743 [Phytophthora cactorum]KAG2823666.1 hypothetical protein PC111_g10142 [Phytophthora cactorum]KAG2824191.1 hypothetical protein PC112_g10204 [Phytophthora cactorum]KAG2860613.1 hypothetical protein PC113_g7910 [Phytophthora cactorum]KAG2915451.1 hypothetical protein PC114_g7830 [Phytophthora cactorum]